MVLLEEPKAALFAFGLDPANHNMPIMKKNSEKKVKKYSVVVRFGGTSLEISLIEHCEGNLTVVASEKNLQLGGRDIDNMIIDHCIEEKYPQAKDLTDDKKTELKHKLRAVCR